MIQLLANAIVVTALGGAAVIVAIRVVEAVIYLSVSGSSMLDSTVVLEKSCKYCGKRLGEETKCGYCGAVRR